MKRRVGILCILQCAVYIGLAVFLGPRWAPLYGVLGVAAALQLAAGGLVLVGRPAQAWVRGAAVASLLAVGLVVGLYLQVGAHAVLHFAKVGAGMGWAIIGGVVAALPWLIFVPIGQLVEVGLGRRWGAASALILLAALLLPSAIHLAHQAPVERYPAHDGAAAAAWLEARWEDPAASAPPSGAGPALLVVAAVEGGVIYDSQTLEGPDLASALLTWEPPMRMPGAALYVDLATARYRLGSPWLVASGVALLPLGEHGLMLEEGAAGTLALWRSKAVRRAELLPGLRVGALDLRKGPARGARQVLAMGSFLAGTDGVVPVQRTWAAPPELSADAVLEVAMEGAHMVARNMTEDGRFAYIVKGPTGELGKGYNYPRHAGAAWYLARAASRSGDPELIAAARAAIDHLGERTFETTEGRAYILDPARDDGQSWVGTTALALLAAIEADYRPDLQLAWSAQVVSSVDEQGIVQGNFDIETASYHDQKRVSYAQGQGTLAVAAAARAGLPGASEALERIAAGWESTYWPMPAGRLFTIGEHWSCSAALVATEVLGQPVGWGICEGYLYRDTYAVPDHDGPVQAVAGAAGGGAEAVVARAERDRRLGRRGEWYDRSMAYAQLFLASAYRPADAPLLGQPERLIGGFRDNPVRLDVQVDAVQHIGCALFGIERLLRDQDLPGGSP
jgi:hypothetical protein